METNGIPIGNYKWDFCFNYKSANNSIQWILGYINKLLLIEIIIYNCFKYIMYI